MVWRSLLRASLPLLERACVVARCLPARKEPPRSLPSWEDQEAKENRTRTARSISSVCSRTIPRWMLHPSAVWVVMLSREMPYSSSLTPLSSLPTSSPYPRRDHQKKRRKTEAEKSPDIISIHTHPSSSSSSSSPSPSRSPSAPTVTRPTPPPLRPKVKFHRQRDADAGTSEKDRQRKDTK